MQKFSVKFKEYKQIGPHTRHLVFEYSENIVSPLEFKAGQFISFHFINKDGKEVRRNYSLANAPQDNTTIALACAYVKDGLASEILFNLSAGDLLQASGPYGIFILKEPRPQRYVFIATGTGVTPYRSMLSALVPMLNDGLKVVLLFGVRSSEELLYRDDFVAFAAAQPNFEFRACYSREMPEEPQPYEFAGRVQQQLNDLNIAADEDLAYLCGNPNMVDATMLELELLGLVRKQICREKYISGR